MSKPRLKIPYISDHHTNKIKRMVEANNLNLQVINTKFTRLTSLNLPEKTERCKCNICTNSKVKNACTKRNVIYSLTCGECDCKYIGKTERQLQFRIREHTKSFNRRELRETGASAMAEHYLSHHNNIVDPKIFTTEIEKICNNGILCTLLESRYIKKTPNLMNRKYEMTKELFFNAE